MVTRQVNGRLPIPAQRGLTEGMLWVQSGPIPGLPVGAAVPTELIPCVDRFVVSGIDFDAHAVAPIEAVVGIVASLVPPRARFVSAGPAPGAVVLQATVYAVRVGVVHRDSVKLADSG